MLKGIQKFGIGGKNLIDKVEDNKFLGLQTDNTVNPHSAWGVVGEIITCWTELLCKLCTLFSTGVKFYRSHWGRNVG